MKAIKNCKLALCEKVKILFGKKNLYKFKQIVIQKIDENEM